MQVVYAYFRDLQVGELTFDGTNYIYKANKENVNIANSKGYFLSIYQCNKDFVSPVLPNPFKDFVLTNKQVLTFPESKIRPFDDDFTRLYKFAKLKDIARPEFYFIAD